MIYIDRKYVPPPLQMGWFLVALNIISGLAFTYFGGLAVYEDILGLMK